jgi:putative DNA primase/helicase
MVDAALGGDVEQRDEVAGQGQRLLLGTPEPWPQPVAGADLLTAIKELFDRYVVLPEGGAAACALWVVFAYCHDAFSTSPILSPTSPTKRCGKTTLLGVLLHLLPKPLPTANVTPASLFRAVEKFRPSLVIDEGDTWLSAGKDDLRGILNSGHTRSTACVVRCEGEDHEPRLFSTWAPKVLALIGTLPDTLQDRSINIPMRRKLPGERVERLRLGQGEEFETLRRYAARWAQDNLAELRAADPDIPDGLNDRAGDSWRPLLAIAEAAGGCWPDLARQAARLLSGEGDGHEEGAPGVLLLRDMQGLFDSGPATWLSSTAITESLAEKEDRPWPEWKHGQPITPRQLARLLAPFGIEPKQRKDGTRVVRGYGREDFEEPWRRYAPEGTLPHPLPSATNMGDRDLREKNIRYPMGAVADRQVSQDIEKQRGSGGSGYEPPKAGDVPVRGAERGPEWEVKI